MSGSTCQLEIRDREHLGFTAFKMAPLLHPKAEGTCVICLEFPALFSSAYHVKQSLFREYENKIRFPIRKFFSGSFFGSPGLFTGSI